MSYCNSIIEEELEKYPVALGSRYGGEELIADRLGLNVDQIIHAVRTEIAITALDAAYGGSHNDGGARDLHRSVLCWVEGLNSIVPDQFAEIANRRNKEDDPEYQRYLELKKRFEN